MKELLEQIFGAEAVTEENFAKFNEELGKRFVAKADYNAKAEEVKALSGQIADRDKQLKELSKAAGDNAELAEQIKQLQADNKDAKDQYEKELSAAKLSAALDGALLKAGALDPDLVKVKLDMDAIQLDGDKLTGLEKQLETVQADYGYLFGDDKPKVSGAAPANAGKPTQAVTPEQFAKMGYQERLNLYNTDNQLYQKLTETEVE